MILENLQIARNIFMASEDADFGDYDVVFRYADGGSTQYPFWNLVNGPIADAIWHSGQIASFRRSSGNPINGKASMLRGKLRK